MADEGCLARKIRPNVERAGIVVKLFGNLRKLKGASRVSLQAGTVRQALVVLCEQNEPLWQAIIDGEKLLPYVKIMVNGHDITLLEGLDTAVKPEDQIAIFPPIAGG